MTKLCFTTTGAWDLADGFGCASLGLAGVCGNDEADNVIELTRLWIDDCVGKNAESFLMFYRKAPNGDALWAWKLWVTSMTYWQEADCRI